MSNVAFLGLGVMGAPMARHLAKSGHRVVVYNRTASKALAWVALNGNQAAPTPAEAADGADLVMLCVGNDDDVREVVLGPNGALERWRRDRSWSTTPRHRLVSLANSLRRAPSAASASSTRPYRAAKQERRTASSQ